MSQFYKNARFGEMTVGKFLKICAAALGVLGVCVLLFVFFVCRVYLGQGEQAFVMNKEGKDLDNTMLLAPETQYKGPQKEPLKEGRHFLNPYFYDWTRPQKAMEIPQDQVGILTRLNGQAPPYGEGVAQDPKQCGIVQEPVMPGRHYLHLWEYSCEIAPMVKIEPGFMGVVTRLAGPLPANPNTFVVEAGARGTQPFLVPPGAYPQYSNKYVFEITPIDIRSQKFEVSGKDAVTFPSKDGFPITAEGTIEWALNPDTLPEVFVKYIDDEFRAKKDMMGAIVRKRILPEARSYFRIVGGSSRAIDFMTGTTRIAVQTAVEKKLRAVCAEEGIIVKSFVIRDTSPPKPIREQYSRRELARREIDRDLKRIEMEVGTLVVEGGKPVLDPQGNAVLDDRGHPTFEGGAPKLDAEGAPLRDGGRIAKVVEERRKDRETQFGEVRSTIREEIRKAEQYAQVETTKANRDLEVARLGLQAAQDEARKIIADGTAIAQVQVMQYQAEASAVKEMVTAFGSGEAYADFLLRTSLAPRFHRVLANTDGSFADLFVESAKPATLPRVP